MIRVEALVADVARKLKRSRRCLARARKDGDVEAIHDLRVASRRLNEPLRLMETWVGVRSSQAARRRLRRLRRAFQHVRDLDVLLIHLVETGTRGLLSAEELAQLEGVLTTRRERALDKARQQAVRVRPGALFREIERIGEQMVRQLNGRPEVPDVALSSLLETRAKAVLALDPQSATVDWHDARLRTKRLRYCVELKSLLLEADAAAFLDLARSTQDMFGHWNDQLVAAAYISREARRRTRLRQEVAWCTHLLEYAASWARAAEEDRGRHLEQWRHFQAATQDLLSGSDISAAPSAPVDERAAEC